MKNQTQYLLKWSLVIALIIMISGCSSLNPLIEPDYPRPDTKWLKEDGIFSTNYKLDWDPNIGYFKTRNMKIDEVRLYARSLQDAYRQAANGQIKYRSAIDAALIGAAAAAVAVATTAGHAKTAGLLGLGAGAFGLAGDRFLIATRKRIWIQGSQALECVIGAANAAPTEINEINLELALIKFNSEIMALDQAINEFNNLNDFGNEKAKEQHKSSISILIGAQSNYQASVNAKERIFPLSQILLSKIIEIRLKVEAEIVKSEPDILSYDQALKKVLATTQPTFAELKNLMPIEPQKTSDQNNTSQFNLDYSEFYKIKPSSVVAFENMLNKRKFVIDAQNKISDILAAIAQTGKNQFSTSLFENCAYNEKIGLESLMINPNAQLDLEPKTRTTVQAIIRGGQRPYSLNTQDILPNEIVVSIDAADRLSVTIPEKLATPGTTLIVPVMDSQSAVKNFVIGFKKEAITTNPANQKSPPPQQQKVDSKVKFIQEKLKSSAKAMNRSEFDPVDVDGKFGLKTRKAVVSYLQSEFPRLSNESNIKLVKEIDPNFPTDGTMPNFADYSDAKLKGLILILLQ